MKKWLWKITTTSLKCYNLIPKASAEPHVIRRKAQACQPSRECRNENPVSWPGMFELCYSKVPSKIVWALKIISTKIGLLLPASFLGFRKITLWIGYTFCLLEWSFCKVTDEKKNIPKGCKKQLLKCRKQ